MAFLAEPRALAEPLVLVAVSGKPACYILKKSSENLTARFSLSLAVLKRAKGTLTGLERGEN
jgi:hypothetical protein